MILCSSKSPCFLQHINVDYKSFESENVTLTHFFLSLFMASCFIGFGIFSIAYLNAVLGIVSRLLNTYWYTSSSYLVHKDFSIQPYPFCTKSSLSNNKLSAISNISSLNRPFLAGINTASNKKRTRKNRDSFRF